MHPETIITTNMPCYDYYLPRSNTKDFRNHYTSDVFTKYGADQSVSIHC